MSVEELKREPLNLIIAGVGGQGNVLMSFSYRKCIDKIWVLGHYL